jgi:hypothetical protein
MKLQPDKSSVQSITGYGAGWIAVDGERVIRKQCRDQLLRGLRHALALRKASPS